MQLVLFLSPDSKRSLDNQATESGRTATSLNCGMEQTRYRPHPGPRPRPTQLRAPRRKHSGHPQAVSTGPRVTGRNPSHTCGQTSDKLSVLGQTKDPERADRALWPDPGPSPWIRETRTGKHHIASAIERGSARRLFGNLPGNEGKERFPTTFHDLCLWGTRALLLLEVRAGEKQVAGRSCDKGPRVACEVSLAELH